MWEQREKAKGRGGATGGVSREMRVRREEGEVTRKRKYPSVRLNGSQTGKATYGEVAPFHTWPVSDLSMSQSAAVSLQGEPKEVVTQNTQ